MKKRIISIFIFIFMLSCCSIYKVNATTSCTLDASLSSGSAKPEDEIQLTVSVNKFNDGIAGVGFTLDFDSSILEITGVEKVSDWTITQTEDSFTVITDNYESTTKEGKIGIIKLRVKNNTVETKTIIKLSALQVTKDDASIENLSEISKELTVKNDKIENDSNTTNEDTSSKISDISEEKSESEQSTNESDSVESTNESDSKQSTKTKTITSTNNNKVNKLPYTGNSSLRWVVLFIIALIAVLSYAKYRKYKKI